VCFLYILDRKGFEGNPSAQRDEARVPGSGGDQLSWSGEENSRSSQKKL
jgi:hypothetical protein